MIRITVFAGPSSADENGPYEASTVVHFVAEREVSEKLQHLGLEWRQADYFPTRQTVITLDPVPDPREPDVKALIREAASKLEETGML